ATPVQVSGYCQNECQQRGNDHCHTEYAFPLLSGRDQRRRSAFSDPLELAEQIPGGLKTFLWRLRQTSFHHIVQLGRHERLRLGQRLRVDARDCRDQQRLCLSLESRFTRDHFIENRSERKNVGSRVRFLPFDLFRRLI